MKYDAVVVGSGPNGLAAAITLARAGRSVHVIEAAETIGGAARSGPLTRPGFVHDLGSAIHPLAVASPFFRTLDLARHGLDWIQPEIALAHPLDDGTAAALHPSLARTSAELGADGAAWERIFGPIVRDWDALAVELLQPMLHVPRHPWLLARFGLQGLRAAAPLTRRNFQGKSARALFAGLAAHSFLPLEAAGTSAFALVLGAAGHVVGWPLPRGGAQRITDALAAILGELGGTIETGRPIGSLRELPSSRTLFLDVRAPAAVEIGGDRIPENHRRRLERFPRGPGAFKIDFALEGPIPWIAESCRHAGTVHLGGPLLEIASTERAVFRGKFPALPFVLLAQPSLFDPTRAPAGKHTAWAYCHVPNGSAVDRTAAIEQQIERFAPGFRDLVLARRVSSTDDLAAQNANLAGGDITGGSNALRHLVARPAWIDPYWLRTPGFYLCSASTPPGGGVHGMCGYWAARSALGRELR